MIALKGALAAAQSETAAERQRAAIRFAELEAEIARLAQGVRGGCRKHQRKQGITSETTEPLNYDKHRWPCCAPVPAWGSVLLIKQLKTGQTCVCQ